MQRPGDNFLASAGFAFEQDGSIRLRGFAHLGKKIPHRRRGDDRVDTQKLEFLDLHRAASAAI